MALIYNASGLCCTSEEELHILGQSESDAILFKTATIEPREGNPKPWVFPSGENLFNRVGLANPGYKAYCMMIPNLKVYNKPLIASITHPSMDVVILEHMIEEFEKAGADRIEINMSCPLFFNGKTSPYYKIRHRIPISFKIRYMQDHNFKQGEYLTIFNSIPSCYPYRGKFISGGLSGPFLKNIVIKELGILKEQQLKDDWKPKIIACGGVRSAQDIKDYSDNGAAEVQIGSLLYKEGPDIFTSLKSTLEDMIVKRVIYGESYSSLLE